MAQRINHSAGSAAATTGWSVVKGGLAGVIVAGAVGAIGVGLVGAALGAGVAGIMGAIGLGIGSVGVAAGLVGVAGAIGGAILGISTGGTAAGIIGSVIGLISGTNKVSAEKSAFELRQRVVTSSHVDEKNAIAQQAFAMGQQSVVQQIQAYQEAQIRAKMAEAAKQIPVGPATAKLAQERAASAAAGKQIAG